MILYICLNIIVSYNSMNMGLEGGEIYPTVFKYNNNINVNASDSFV